MNAVAATNKATPEELVKQKYPAAFVDDDGSWIYIRVRKIVADKCPTCRQDRTDSVVDYSNTLGSAGNESAAWKSAAQNVGLL
jgi:hypothetical protein